jgi:hypothetical protein
MSTTLEEQVRQLILEVERLKAVQAINNLMGRYENYHTASMQKETVELFAHKTPGVWLDLDTFGVWEGIEGVRRFFLDFIGTYETDLTGRIYQHELTTPIVEVAEDCQTARGIWSSPGVETHRSPDPVHGELTAMWMWAKYQMDFVKEDGEWKIWHFNLYTTFITPYEGKGWVANPIGEWTMPDKFGPDRPSLNFAPYHPEKADFNAHNLVPALPMPYRTFGA